MGCCASNLKLKELSLNSSIYMASGASSARSLKRLYSSRNSSGLGSGSSTANSSNDSSNRSIWSRCSSQPICDDFAEQPQLERSCGYHTCSSAASSPRKNHTKEEELEQGQEMKEEQELQMEDEEEEDVNPLMRTQDMSNTSMDTKPSVGNLEWEMYMMQQAQRIMPKTSSPISQRRGQGLIQAGSYQKWRNYLQSTPAHMLHNVTHIPEAIAGHFCPKSFPGFTDLEEMESAAKRFKVDVEVTFHRQQQQQQQQQEQELDLEMEEPLYTTSQLLAGHTHTISTDL